MGLSLRQMLLSYRDWHQDTFDCSDIALSAAKISHDYVVACSLSFVRGPQAQPHR